MIKSWTGKRVTVMGLGRFGGGVGVTRWLAAQGAHVTVTDAAKPAALAKSMQEIAGLPVDLHLGGHEEEDFTAAELVVASPAVPQDSRFLEAARSAGVPISSEMNLFVERCRGTCVGITGSVGKSTITAMIGHVLTKASGRRVWVGGNIGKSLLDALDRIETEDLVVLELSSFQLEITPQVRWSPYIAVIANVTPNHLDRHGTFAAYLAAKLNILRFQTPGRDVAIVQDSPELRRNFELMFGDVSGLWRYGVDGRTPVARMQSDAASDCDDKTLSWPELKLSVPGTHNRLNAAAALTVAHALNISRDAAVAALGDFEALPDRLQRVAERDGVIYYNDSKSTTPEATLTAMEAVEAPLLLILGGYDKGIDLAPLARAVAQRVKFAACIGQTGPGLAETILAAGGKAATFDLFKNAVDGCRTRAVRGDAVLLSPACASYDMFEDYRARGAAFTELAQSS